MVVKKALAKLAGLCKNLKSFEELFEENVLLNSELEKGH